MLIVDDIFDTGQTMDYVITRLRAGKPADIRTCVLLEKQCPKAVDFKPDYAAFKVADEFVVGYGLDYEERYRNLPFIAILSDGPENE